GVFLQIRTSLNTIVIESCIGQTIIDVICLIRNRKIGIRAMTSSKNILIVVGIGYKRAYRTVPPNYILSFHFGTKVRIGPKVWTVTRRRLTIRYPAFFRCANGNVSLPVVSGAIYVLKFR